MVINTPVQVRDYSITLTGSAQSVLAADSSRSFLMVQAPSAQAVTFSFTTATPAAGAVGCFTLAAGSAPVIFGPNVPNGALYAIGTSGVFSVTASS